MSVQMSHTYTQGDIVYHRFYASQGADVQDAPTRTLHWSSYGNQQRGISTLENFLTKRFEVFCTFVSNHPAGGTCPVQCPHTLAARLAEIAPSCPAPTMLRECD